jgi:hypothetical protein
MKGRNLLQIRMKVVRGHIDIVLLLLLLHRDSLSLLLGFDEKISRSRKSIARDLKMECKLGSISHRRMSTGDLRKTSTTPKLERV